MDEKRFSLEDLVRFAKFLASAEEVPAEEDFEAQTGEELQAGEIGVFFDGNTMWAVKKADGTYRTVIERSEPSGSLEYVAACCFEWAKDEGRFE